MEASRTKNGLEQTSMAAALGDMFPADLGPLIDMSGKVYAHTVSTQPVCDARFAGWLILICVVGCRLACLVLAEVLRASKQPMIMLLGKRRT